ncbi:MAG: 30S ribosomal protein S18 [Holosporaceae bacterium]|nr:30S ribosomal protein S18 [Holosporaceae bacterium]
MSGYKKKSCPFEGGALKIDYKDPRPLQKFISERGKIMPCRISMVSARKQRALSLAVKRARFLALLPYVAE